MLQAIEAFLNRIGNRLQGFVDGAPINAEEKTRLFNYSIFLALGLPTMLVYGMVNLLKANYLLCFLIFLSGGEEFGVLLVGTNPDDAHKVAERLRREFAEVRLPVEGGNLGFTVSIGVTSAIPKDPSMAAVLKRADQAHYQAKAEGRNRVVCR
jgi:predicted signal transduction protein with EAL and GGDEF domain